MHRVVHSPNMLPIKIHYQVLLPENHHRQYIRLSATFRRLIVYVKLMAGVLKCYVGFFS
jgi:hypothetical protein